MLEILTHCFAAVCGQSPEHTWQPGGWVLPCCQRCTGLYVGAAVAICLHLWARPGLTGRFLEVHGLFLLVMIPLGFHWLAQGAVLRTISGELFGFGIVAFLWLPLIELRHDLSHGLPGKAERTERLRDAFYFLCLLAVLVFLPAAAGHGGRAAAYLISMFICSGALGVAALVVVGVAVLGLNAVRLTGRWLATRS